MYGLGMDLKDHQLETVVVFTITLGLQVLESFNYYASSDLEPTV